MPFRKVDAYVRCFLHNSNLTAKRCPDFPYGRKLVDSFGDFIIFFYDASRDQVMYCFKDAEEYWFPCEAR